MSENEHRINSACDKLRMKNKYILEYPMNCSPIVLYPRLSTPGGLSEWFADNVNVDGKNFVFYWDDTAQTAEVVNKRENSFIRFKWVSSDDNPESENNYFEFRSVTDEKRTSQLVLQDVTKMVWGHQ